MALQITSQAGRLVKSIGAFTELACGIAGGSGTSTEVTVPNLKRVDGVVCMSAVSVTAVYCATTSGNSFTATHANNDSFFWIAWGIPKA